MAEGQAKGLVARARERARARPVYVAAWLAMVALGLSAVGLAAWSGALTGLWPTEPEILPLLRLGAAALLILAAVGAGHALAGHAERRFTTSWWDPATRAYDAPLEWSDVYALVACDPKTDPLGVEPIVRPAGLWRPLLYLLAALAVWGILLSGLDLVRDPRPLRFMLVPEGQRVAPGLAAVIANPTAYLALLAAVVTLVVAYYQLRAKVRADSRQQWIIHARELIGQVVALTDDFQDLRRNGRFREAEAMWNRMNPLRLELELMLNPSEKDHRLLLYLIQRFASRDRNAEPIQDAKICRDSINESIGSDREMEAGWKRILDAPRKDQISYILRLSHVVLKREWERVKHTR